MYISGKEIFMNIFRELQFEIPSGYDLSQKVPRNTIMAAIISLIAVLAMTIILCVLVRKRQKGKALGVFAGIAAYMIFFYFAGNTVVNILFGTFFKDYAETKAVLVIVLGLVMSLVPMFGRLLVMKLMSQRMTKASDALSVGVGIMVTEGFLYMVDLLMVVVSCNTINKTGIEAIVSSAGTQEEFTETLDSIFEMINYRAADFFYIGVAAIALMIFHLAVTVIIFAVFQKRESKGWYVFGFAAYFIIQLLNYMANYGVVSVPVKIITMILVTAITAFFALRMYKIYYKKEEFAEQKKAEAAQKKMPKFDNLSKL